MDTVAFDPREFRRALGAFVTGVTVVTTLEADGVPRGFTANSFTSVSLDPPLILICIARTASAFPVFAARGHFAVNVLAGHQQAVSNTFASKVHDKFAQIPWTRARTGSPLIRDVAAWFDCQTHQMIDAGDHTILIGRVLDFDHAAHTPLGFCRGSYLTFGQTTTAQTAS